MKRIIHPNITQCQFDFDSLTILPVPNNAEIGLTITPLPETQEHWWSNLEYRHIPRKLGIYAIVNTFNGHIYIGSAISLYNRKGQHFRDLRKDKHDNSHLQRAYDRYGADAFRFVIGERVEVAETLIEREQYYIDTLNPHYNIARIAGSCLGIKHTDEAKEKMSAAKKGRPAYNKGKKASDEARANMSAAHKGCN